jgi:hypothetical protein
MQILRRVPWRPFLVCPVREFRGAAVAAALALAGAAILSCSVVGVDRANAVTVTASPCPNGTALNPVVGPGCWGTPTACPQGTTTNTAPAYGCCPARSYPTSAPTAYLTCGTNIEPQGSVKPNIKLNGSVKPVAPICPAGSTPQNLSAVSSFSQYTCHANASCKSPYIMQNGQCVLTLTAPLCPGGAAKC